MKFFLKSKHWQLFIVVVGIPLVMEIVAFALMFAKMFSFILSNTQPDPIAMMSSMWSIIPLIMVVSIIIFFLWFYTLGVNLHRKLPSSVKMDINLFRVFISYPVVYMLVFCFVMRYMVLHVMQTADNHSPIFFPASFLFVIPFHLFSIFCVFYCIYFVSKSLKSVALQREALAGDYIVDFILFWFFIVGIWFLQPTINKIFADDSDQLISDGV